MEFEDGKKEISEWIDESRPKSSFPHECSVAGCEMRANTKFDVVVRGNLEHFCSGEHQMSFLMSSSLENN